MHGHELRIDAPCRVVRDLRRQYIAEAERLAKAERERITACRRRLALLNARSAAMAATREAIASAEMGGNMFS